MPRIYSEFKKVERNLELGAGNQEPGSSNIIRVEFIIGDRTGRQSPVAGRLSPDRSYSSIVPLAKQRGTKPSSQKKFRGLVHWATSCV